MAYIKVNQKLIYKNTAAAKDTSQRDGSVSRKNDRRNRRVVLGRNTVKRFRAALQCLLRL